MDAWPTYLRNSRSESLVGVVIGSYPTCSLDFIAARQLFDADGVLGLFATRVRPHRVQRTQRLRARDAAQMEGFGSAAMFGGACPLKTENKFSLFSRVGFDRIRLARNTGNNAGPPCEGHGFTLHCRNLALRCSGHRWYSRLRS